MGLDKGFLDGKEPEKKEQALVRKKDDYEKDHREIFFIKLLKNNSIFQTVNKTNKYSFYRTDK